MGRVSGRVAIVTGAAGGIGLATARLLAREGARVVATDLRPAAPGDGLAEFLEQDVTSEAGWAELTAQVLARHGRLDILVNNAAIAFPNGSVEQQSLADWRRVMAVNADGVFLGTQHGIRAMRRAGNGGAIVNISSILGIAGSGTTAAYTASKGAVRLLTKSAALHCAQARTGIRVNSVHPGYIWTPMLEETLARRSADPVAERRRIEALTPLGHTGEPDDIAYGVLYLASDEAKFVTGTELVIDGGYLAQ